MATPAGQILVLPMGIRLGGLYSIWGQNVTVQLCRVLCFERNITNVTGDVPDIGVWCAAG